MNKSLAKVGGTCSILLGVSYVVVGIAYVLTPAEQFTGLTEKFAPSYAETPTPFTLLLWTCAVGAVIALGAVPAITALVEKEDEGCVRWMRNLAYLGFGVTALEHFRWLVIMPARAAAYQAGDAATKAAIVASDSFVSLDPYDWLKFGCVGLWVLVVSIVALRRSVLPKALAYLGIAGAILYGVYVAGVTLKVPTLALVGAGLGASIIAPIWYIWVGVILRRKAS